MTRLSGTQPLQEPHIDMVITSRSGLLIETRTNLAGLKQFLMVCGVRLTRIYEFSWNDSILFDAFQSFILFIILKYCEKMSKIKRRVILSSILFCNLNHIHEIFIENAQVSKWILYNRPTVKNWQPLANFTPWSVKDSIARMISYLHDIAY